MNNENIQKYKIHEEEIIPLKELIKRLRKAKIHFFLIKKEKRKDYTKNCKNTARTLQCKTGQF